jgi:hypothetical protein
MSRPSRFIDMLMIYIQVYAERTVAVKESI